MKKYRIYYWFGSITTEIYIMADNEKAAIAEFKKKHDFEIINIECCE